MKKLRLSFLLLLTAMLVCVMTLTVFADDDDDDYWDGPGFGPVPAGAETIEPDDVKDVTLNAIEEISTFVFTPNKAGDYFFEGLGENDTEGVVFTETGDIDSNYDDGTGDNFIVYFHAEAGVTYYLQSRLEMEAESPYQVRLGQGAKPIGFAHVPDNPLVLPGIYDDDEDSNFVEGEFSAAGEVVTLKYVPSEEGFYQFAYNNDESEYYYDLCVFTEDALINMVDGDADNMYVNFYGDPGVTYYFQMRSQTAGGRYTAYVRQDNEMQSESGGISICGKEILSYDEDNDEYLVSDDLPDGVAFDFPSRTITLTNCSIDFGGTDECNEYILSGGDLNIVLNGTNTFTGLGEAEDSLCTGIKIHGRLSIKGSGSLNMSMIHSTGIEAEHSIEIDGPSVNITGLPCEDPAMFYGMTITSWENMFRYPNASSQFFIKINNAKLHISNTAAGAALNMGIDSQDADLSISNSEVSLDLNGGKTWGMGTGLYKSGTGKAYGGKLSIDDKSRVKIKLSGTHEDFISDNLSDDLLYALYFYENDINSKYIYAAKHGESAKEIQKTDFWVYQVYNRMEGHYSFMDFSPTEQSYGNSGHIMEYHSNVTPTCTTGGNSEYWYCTDCYKYFSDAEGENEIVKDSWVLASLGHHAEHYDREEPTENYKGWKENWYCYRCNKHFADAECTKVYYNTNSLSIPATSHVHEMEHKDANPATALYSGNLEYYYCSGCGKYFSDEAGDHEYEFGEWKLPPTGGDDLHVHSMSKTEAVAATCTAAGNTEYYHCSGCGKYFSDEAGKNEIEKDSWVIKALGHSMSKTEAVAATCTTAGNTEYYYCSGCRKYFSDEAGKNEIEKDSWIIKALGHSMSKTEAVEATCTAAGNTEYYHCSGCKKYFSDAAGKNEIAKDSWVIKALGHDMEQHAAVDPTATEPGNSEYFHCSTCGKYFADADGKTEIEEDSWILPPTGDEPHEHSMSKTEAVEATCTNAGNTEYYYCSGCKKYFSDEAGKNEIEKGSWVIKALGHSMSKTEAVDPTATEPGNSEYYHCSTCGKYFADADGKTEIEVDSWIIPPTGDEPHEHSMSKTEAVDATCTTAGNTEYYYCSGCGKYFSDEAGENEITKGSWGIKALGHDMEKHAAVDPTATEPGNSEYYHCSTCGKYFADADGKTEIEEDSWILPPTGDEPHEHIMVFYEADEPTCYIEGNTAYWYCVGCGKYFSDEAGENEIEEDSWILPLLPHTLVHVEAEPATAYTDGNREYWYCSECYCYFDDEDGKNEIEYGDWVIPATGDDSGYEEDLEAAEAVEELINSMDPDDADSVAAARAAYDALTDDQKALVDYEVLQKLEDAENAISTDKIDLSTLDFKELSSYSWDGDEQRPCKSRAYLNGGKTTYLTRNKDYTTQYLNNINAGTATVILTGIGDYTGTKELYFDITPLNMESYKASVIFYSKSYTYDGKVKTPRIALSEVAEDPDYQLLAPFPTAKDYKLTCSTDRRSVGTHRVTFTFHGNYTGALTYTFNINPKGVRLSKVKAGKKSMTVKWKALKEKMAKSNITGYQIRYSRKSNMQSPKTVTVKGCNAASKKITKLKSKKKYYVQIRTYMKVGRYTYYSAWSSSKSVKAK